MQLSLNFLVFNRFLFLISAPILASEKSLSMKYLLDAAKNHLAPHQVPKFLSSVLLQLAEAKGRPKAGDMMKKSGLSLSQFMPSDQVPTFKTDYVSSSQINTSTQYSCFYLTFSET